MIPTLSLKKNFFLFYRADTKPVWAHFTAFLQALFFDKLRDLQYSLPHFEKWLFK